MLSFEHHILRRYARLCFQEDLLHIAYATTTPRQLPKRSLDIPVRGILRLIPHHVF